MSQLGTEGGALQHTEEEAEPFAPTRAHIGEIQAKIDMLQKDGSDQIQKLRNHIQLLEEGRHIKKEEKNALIIESNTVFSTAQAVENKNQAEVVRLAAEVESYLKEHYERDCFGPISENCEKDRENAKQRYRAWVVEFGKEREREVQHLRKRNTPDLQQELKDENYVYENKLFDAKVIYEQELQAIKDRRHETFAEQYRMIDLLRMSHLTFAQKQTQHIENYKYTFNQRQFLLENGSYIIIVMIFIALSTVTPIVKNTQLFTYNNILNILQQASPRTFLALDVASLILLTGTDLSIGRMTGMGMVAATIIMHKSINTGVVFGKILDFAPLPYAGRAIFTLLVCIVLTTCFTSVAGFFTAYFKVRPFTSTMLNMLIVFGLVTYVTKGVSFDTIGPGIASIIVPKINDFPLTILWTITAIVIVWFIWNGTRFGKNLYAVGGSPEATSISGISVSAVTMGAFMMAGMLYGLGAWPEYARMVGSGSTAYGQGWDMNAIAAYMVGGVSFTGGIGKISGVVVGVLVFTTLTYSLIILGIDTNLQFVFESIIILTTIILDYLKYVQKK